MSFSRATFGVATAIAACSLLPLRSPASTFRHDVDPEVHVNYGDGFHLVGGVTVDITSFGTGVVIHPEWVLTAAHVVGGVNENSNIRFETDPDPADTDELPLTGLYGITQVAIHEYYNDGLGPQGGFDIALLKLDRPVDYYTPYNRFRASPVMNAEIGRMGTHVGFGNTGDGRTGYVPNSGGFFRLAGDNMIDGSGNDPRMIDENGDFLFFERNVVDSQGNPVHFTAAQIAGQFVMADFDDPASTLDDPNTSADELYINDGKNALGDVDPLALESSVAPGDSGGPMMFYINGAWVIGGTNIFIHALEPPDGDRLYTPDDPGGALSDNASYSDLSGYLRITQFNDWIDGVIGIPEPSGIVAVALIAIPALLRRHRRSPSAAAL